MMKSYRCPSCDEEFEFNHHPRDEPAVCPRGCSSTPEWSPSTAGGPSVFRVNIPDYPGSQRLMAGYAHKYTRPAEKNSVVVPRTYGDV